MTVLETSIEQESVNYSETEDEEHPERVLSERHAGKITNFSQGLLVKERNAGIVNKLDRKIDSFIHNLV